MDIICAFIEEQQTNLTNVVAVLSFFTTNACICMYTKYIFELYIIIVILPLHALP